ncbi:MAG: hypothetical protein ACRDCE_23105, partial [Cetobacterium sp.]|uniref:hypothetical protein n=1 Tax=Cetobacterium sp. TaxID=2071632 RepID=UPI003EE6AF09
DRLVDIRTKSLNPVITRVEAIDDLLQNTIQPEVKKTFKKAEFDEKKKQISFTLTDDTSGDVLDLSSLDKPFPGITVEGVPYTLDPLPGGGGKETNVTYVKFKLGNIEEDADGTTLVSYDWDKIVRKHQSYPEIRVEGETVNNAYNLWQFKGEGCARYFTYQPHSSSESHDAVLTLDLPLIPDPLKAQVTTTGDKKAITDVILTGYTDGSEIDNGVLTINLPKVGGGGVVSGANFQGFFDNEGELISSVDNPLNGKSYAFVKDSKLKGQYYTPYMYASNKWQEAPIDPALTYEDPKATDIQGVFSIKPSPHITVDKTGQLDLDGLLTSNFKGFFETEAALNAVPNPIPDVSYAFLKTATGLYMGKRYVRGASGNEWQS